jgi:hypothetical protein
VLGAPDARHIGAWHIGTWHIGAWHIGAWRSFGNWLATHIRSLSKAPSQPPSKAPSGVSRGSADAADVRFRAALF